MGNYLNSSFRRRWPIDEHMVPSDFITMTDPPNNVPNCSSIKSSFSLISSSPQGKNSLSKCSVGRASRSASRASSGVNSVATACGGNTGVGSKKTTVSSHASSNSGEDSEIEKLRIELRESKRQVYEREQQLLKLHREIHKLRSVLDHSDAINALKPSLSMTMLLSTDNSADKLYPNKKQGVSGESYGSMTSLGDPMQNINFVWKDYDCRRIIQEALLDNSFLKNYLNQEQLDLIVDSMYEKEFSKSCYICRRGTYGSHLYVITYGHCEVIDSRDRPVNQIGPGKAFGELALLYNCTRTASVKTLTRVRTWVLDRKVFQMIMMKTCLDRTQSLKQFLKSVPLLRELNDEKISKISDVIEVDFYPRGDYICKQGSYGDSFYIISKGSVRVTQVHETVSKCDKTAKNGPMVTEETIRTLSVGDYFGEQALLLGLDQQGDALSSCASGNGGAIRTANVISEECECLVLDQANFFTLLGDLHEIRCKSYTDTEDEDFSTGGRSISSLDLATVEVKVNGQSKPDDAEQIPDPSLNRLTLDDFEHIAQLGMGGFGIVNLVRSKTNSNQVFALKRCSKEFVRASHQQQHIINEKLVMQRVSGRHQFVIQLYRTFRDDSYVYFLMETALGGELWTVLRQRGPFGETTVRFYMACVIEALQFLHSNNIIYRDLKPENCLLDSDGYLKITDFGFSKFLQPGDKTWTFCGTPEYVAPEIILNRGHDKSVDIWALGILLYELLTGIPPFTSSDPLQTYHIILRGFDSIGFDENVFSKHCVNLIRSLCRENPGERLGVRGRNGYSDIKRHKWFAGFNWNNLIARKMVPPIVPQLSSNVDTRYYDTTEVAKQDSSNHSSSNNSNRPSCLMKNSSKLSISPKRSSSPNNNNNNNHLTAKISSSDRRPETTSLVDYNTDWESYF